MTMIGGLYDSKKVEFDNQMNLIKLFINKI